MHEIGNDPGRVGLTLAHPWSDGTRALVFDPVEFLVAEDALDDGRILDRRDEAEAATGDAGASAGHAIGSTV